MPSKQITSQCSALPPSPSPYATCFVPVVLSKYLSCILRTSWTKLCFSLGSCSHTHTGMAVFAMLKYVAHNIFSSRHIWFRSSCSSLPRAVHFSATPQPCMPSVVPCTAVCNLGCSMSHDHFCQHHWKSGGCRGGWERMNEWMDEWMHGWGGRKISQADFVVEENIWNNILRWEIFFLSAFLLIITPPISRTLASTATQTCRRSQNNQFTYC